MVKNIKGVKPINQKLKMQNFKILFSQVLAMLLERVNIKIFNVNFTNLFSFYLWVKVRFKVGDNYLYGVKKFILVHRPTL